MTVLGRARDCAGRYLGYASTVSGTTQYYAIGTKLCCLTKVPSFYLKIQTTGATAADTVALYTACCGAVLPVVASSTMASIAVSDVPVDTVL